MLSLRSLAIACFGLGLLASPTFVRADEVITIDYSNAEESFRFNGDGQTSSTPLFGISQTATTTGKLGSGQPIFQYSASYLAPSTYCCHGGFIGLVQQSCTPVSSTPLKTPANFVFNVDTVYKLSCGSPKQDLFVEFRYFAAAPVIGLVDWVVDAPESPLKQGVPNGSPVVPGTYAIPFVSKLQFSTTSGTDIIPVLPVIPPTEPSSFYTVVDNNNSPEPNLYGSAGSAVYSFGSTSPGSNTITDFVACGLQVSPGQWIAVNDNYGWPVPSTGFADYYPQCFFKALSGNGLNTVIVSLNVHIRVLAPCVATSGKEYDFSDIVSKLGVFPGVSNDIHLFDINNNGPNPLNAPLHFDLHLPYKVTSGTFPFYSLLEGADGLPILDDPIGNYWLRLKYLSLPGNAGKKLPHPFSWPTGPGAPAIPVWADDAKITTDSNQAIICRNVADPTNIDETISYALANDLFLLDVTAKSLLIATDTQDFNFFCYIFDTAGTVNQVQITVTVWYDVSKPICTGSGCVNTDPQFMGFLGQSYQIHGVSGNVYNILSTPRLQYNALFTYLSEGRCRKGTACYSHPGNYFGSVGVSIRSDDGSINRIEVISGPVDVLEGVAERCPDGRCCDSSSSW